MSIQTVRGKRRDTARNLAAQHGVSDRTVRRLKAQSRQEWLQEQRERRRAILETYEISPEMTWEMVGAKFGVKSETARSLGMRARREREAEEREKVEPPLPLDELVA